jgi:hypothetical protein
MKSPRLAINVLIELNNLKQEPKATFDFVNETIFPASADTRESRELLNDYRNWLPGHFVRHNCDLAQIELLEITIWVDFENAKEIPKMKECKQFVIYTLTRWKAIGREVRMIEISQTEIIREQFLSTKVPEFA